MATLPSGQGEFAPGTQGNSCNASAALSPPGLCGARKGMEGGERTIRKAKPLLVCGAAGAADEREISRRDGIKRAKPDKKREETVVLAPQRGSRRGEAEGGGEGRRRGHRGETSRTRERSQTTSGKI